MHRMTDKGTSSGQLSTGKSDAKVLSDEIVEFIESGLSIIVGVVGTNGRAQTGRALAARVVGRSTIRIIYPSEGNSAVMATAQAGGPIAVTFSAPLSHRTIQIKGGLCKTEPLDPEDQINADRQAEAFAGVLRALGHTAAFVKAICDYRSSTLRVLSFPAEAAFEQTPGPGAGRSI